MQEGPAEDGVLRCWYPHLCIHRRKTTKAREETAREGKGLNIFVYPSWPHKSAERFSGFCGAEGRTGEDVEPSGACSTVMGPQLGAADGCSERLTWMCTPGWEFVSSLIWLPHPCLFSRDLGPLFEEVVSVVYYRSFFLWVTVWPPR